MKIRLFGTANDSIVDGPGIRYTIFVQGCTHNCPGCHNPKSHDMDGGYEDDTEKLISCIKENPLLDGVTFSGGEPFLQAEPLIHIATEVRKSGLNVFAYTGYTIEQLMSGANDKNKWQELLERIDTLIDGRFEEDKKSYELIFKGSSNQRIIDVKKTLETGIITEINL